MIASGSGVISQQRFLMSSGVILVGPFLFLPMKVSPHDLRMFSVGLGFLKKVWLYNPGLRVWVTGKPAWGTQSGLGYDINL